MTIGPLVGAAYGLRVAHRITDIGVGRLLDAIVRPVVAASVMAGAVLALDRLLIDAADKETVAGLMWTGVEGLVAIAIYMMVFRILSPAVAQDVGGAARGGHRKPAQSPPELGGVHMSDTPAFSVVVPAYNASRTIGATIGSVLRQSHEDLELIVVDDGSSDGTPDLVREFGANDERLRLVEQPNKGTAGARNTGIGEARADLVAFLDNDDMWMPSYLEMMGAALERAPEAGFAYTDAWIFNDATGRILKKPSLEHYEAVPDPAPPADLLSRFLGHLNFVMSSTTVRREALEATGGFDESIRGADDFDLWVRIAAKGYGAVRADGINLVQRDRSDSQSKDLPMMIENARAVLQNATANDDLSEADRALAQESVAELSRFLGTLSGDRKASALAWRIRSRLGPVRQRIAREQEWMPELPADVAAALPELSAQDRG